LTSHSLSVIIDNMKEKLRTFGFSEKEVEIYLALFALGSSRAADIAKHAGINRSTAYVILESLSKRGLIGAIEEHGIRQYSPTPPEKLASYLEDMAKQYAGFSSTAKKLIPELKSLIPKKTKEASPKVRLFEGEQAMKTVYEDTLASLESIRAYASVENTGKAKSDVRVQVILPDTPQAKTQIAESKEEAEEAFRVPSGKYGFTSEINIYDDKIIFISPEEKFGLVIESPEFARTLRTAFVSARKEAAHMDKMLTLRPREAR